MTYGPVLHLLYIYTNNTIQILITRRPVKGQQPTKAAMSITSERVGTDRTLMAALNLRPSPTRTHMHILRYILSLYTWKLLQDRR